VYPRRVPPSSLTVLERARHLGCRRGSRSAKDISILIADKFNPGREGGGGVKRDAESHRQARRCLPACLPPPPLAPDAPL